MEAIDDLANENIVRSVAFTALQFRQQRNVEGLLPVSTQVLQQRVRYLGDQSESTDEDKDYILQWQKDDCPRVIDLIWNGYEEDLYQSKIFYKRSDAETLHAIVEFAAKDDKHYVVVVAKEDGAEDQEWKYHNTREINDEEWKKTITTEWSKTIEDAERKFIQDVTKHNEDQKKLRKEKKLKRKGKKSTKGRGGPEEHHGGQAPDDYWGDWSSENGSQDESGDSNTSHASDSDESDDGYYNNWSQHPESSGSVPEDDLIAEDTPPDHGKHLGIPTFVVDSDSHRQVVKRSSMEQQEIQEEYDTSHNPLFTVPSVPNLMDMHTSALQELTTILNSTIQHTEHDKLRTINMNPLPKVMYYRQQEPCDYDNGDDSSSRAESVKYSDKVPGGWPESRQEEDNTSYYAITPGDHHVKYGDHEASGTNSDTKDTAKSFLMKSLSALVAVARMLGFTGRQISDMVDQIVQQQEAENIPQESKQTDGAKQQLEKESF
ncbi:hypothetical protein NQZ79_g6200 [Umbelopsis isabellina]|nr:hypothetical protein NQZ79_g6200 [Umbelopsis isabellina]